MTTPIVTVTLRDERDGKRDATVTLNVTAYRRLLQLLCTTSNTAPDALPLLVLLLYVVIA